MFVSFVRSSRFLRAAVVTTGLFSFFAWLYVVARVVVNGVDVNKPFVASVPSISFFSLGMFSFAVSFVSTFLYVWLWSRFDPRPR